MGEGPWPHGEQQSQRGLRGEAGRASATPGLCQAAGLWQGLGLLPISGGSCNGPLKVILSQDVGFYWFLLSETGSSLRFSTPCIIWDWKKAERTDGSPRWRLPGLFSPRPTPHLLPALSQPGATSSQRRARSGGGHKLTSLAPSKDHRLTAHMSNRSPPTQEAAGDIRHSGLA